MHNIKVKKTLMPQHKGTITLAYACEIGQPDYMEGIIYECQGYTNLDELEAACIAYAEKNNIDRIRITVLDMGVKPDFAKSVNL